MLNNNCCNGLSPFKWFVLENFPFIEADFDALTNYELYCKVIGYLNQTIDKTNVLGEQVVALTNNLNDLKNYVDNYFENLDISDDINKKLDEMAASGQLADIVGQYLQLAGVLAFNTVAELKVATNITNGSICKTLGFHTINDGGNALYKIRNITNLDVVDNMSILSLSNENLIAELIVDVPNIKQLGAYGNGADDDTNIIQQAINKYSKIYFNKGKYLISNTLNMNSCKELIGENPTNTIIISNEKDKDILQLYNGTTYNIIIKNLGFNHEIIGSGNGIVFGNTGVWELNLIENCRFMNNNVALLINRNTGSLFSSRLADLEIFNFNEAAIEFYHVGSSGNVYENIYCHNNGRTSNFGVVIWVENNLSINNVNIEWSIYSTASIYLYQVDGIINNLHFEGIEAIAALYFGGECNIDIHDVFINNLLNNSNIIRLINNNNNINIDILKLVNFSDTIPTINLFLYNNTINDTDNINILNSVIPSNINFIKNDVKFGCHNIPSTFDSLISKKIKNNWLLYSNNDIQIKDANVNDMINFMSIINKNNEEYTRAICIAGGTSNDVLVTDSASFTQYQSSIKYPKTAGLIQKNQALKINNEIVYSTNSSYSSSDTEYTININKPLSIPTGNYSLYKTGSIFKYLP